MTSTQVAIRTGTHVALKAAWAAERDTARAARADGDATVEWRHLERAHVLSQPMAWRHLVTHALMFSAAWRRRDRRELAGQMVRLLLAVPGSVSGRYPAGNTGGADVSAFRTMPIPDDLRSLVPQPTPLSTEDSPPSPSEPQSGPIARVVAGSLTVGLLGAAALTLAVYPGAPEHVITGSSLVAFAVGWALLALLSARLTTFPQRWAFVPAAAMGATGIGLVLFAPGNGAMSAASWVWPPAALVLAGWTVVHVRRSLVGRGRWFLYPVVGALAVGAVGGMYESVALVVDNGKLATPGASYDVGGHRLHLDCTGSGGPTIVLETGLGATSPVWGRIAPSVSGTTRVCSYDRAGQGWSDETSRPQDALAVAADLHTLLDRAGESGPYVLVGHSAGGVYAMTYAAQYPSEVAGMVLLDSSTPYQFTALPDFEMTYAMTKRLYGVAPTLARMGLARLVPGTSGLPEPSGGQLRAFETSPRHMRNVRDEHSQYRAAFEQAKALTSLSDKPLVVVTATKGQQRGWSAAQVKLAALSTNSQHRLAATTHAEMLTDDAGSDASIAAIEDVVQSARSGSPVAAR